METRKKVEALFAATSEKSMVRPAFLVSSSARDADLQGLPPVAASWAEAIGFSGETGAFSLAPGADGAPMGALVGVGDAPAGSLSALGGLPRLCPARFDDAAPPPIWRAEGAGASPAAAALAWALGAYKFDRYTRPGGPTPLYADPAGDISDAERHRLLETAAAVYLARDLVNTPAMDLSPEALHGVAEALASAHDASFSALVGPALVASGFPMIFAVGAGAMSATGRQPRLLEIAWGDPARPKVTLVGKGVCFDTGGLDIKPSRAMRNMKKDMGGAAAALAVAHLVMALDLPVRLRVLIPAVENAVDAESFRPGDVLRSRAGISVEVGDTDAEGRLVLADALTYADEDAPDLILDFATLTGAARVALGPDLPPFYTDDDALAGALSAAAEATEDPLWRMPLWRGYEADLSSRVADICSVSSSGFAGSVTAALFLKRFVREAGAWAHFDIFAWNPKTRPGRPEGGEASAVRAVAEFLSTWSQNR